MWKKERPNKSLKWHSKLGLGEREIERERKKIGEEPKVKVRREKAHEMLIIKLEGDEKIVVHV